MTPSVTLVRVVEEAGVKSSALEAEIRVRPSRPPRLMLRLGKS